MLDHPNGARAVRYDERKTGFKAIATAADACRQSGDPLKDSARASD